MELEQHGEGDSVLAGQDVRLPRWAVALQRTLHQLPGDRVEVGGRGVQPDVVERVEVRVVLAGGAAEGERGAASRSAAWAPAVGECAVKTPSAPRCIGCRSDSMFQKARSRGASRSEVKGLPRVDDGGGVSATVKACEPITVKYDHVTHS